MSALGDIKAAYDTAVRIYSDTAEKGPRGAFRTAEVYGTGDAASAAVIAHGDNLEYMRYLIAEKGLGETFRLIYADPPFFSRSRYMASFRLRSPGKAPSGMIKAEAYDDHRRETLKDYLAQLSARIMMMRDLLSDEGCLCVHLDWHASHYVRVLMDEIFGRDCFINEIIWTYKSGGSSRRNFARKHDTLLLYGKSRAYRFEPLKEKSYNRGMKPYRFKGVEEFRDKRGWYTEVNMKDVWNIDMVGRTSHERTGYATQKPEKLMERIIRACSDEGSLCGDFYAGSGSFGAVCASLGRKIVMCDEGKLAVSDMAVRLAEDGTAFTVERKENDDTAEGVNAEITEDGRHVRITGLDVSKVPEAAGLSDEIKEYAKEDSLSLIKAWSAAPEGRVHRADRLMRGDIRLTEIPDGCHTGELKAVCYDVFGNRYGTLPGRK